RNAVVLATSFFDNASNDSVRALESSVRGELVRPGDEHYDEARLVWNRKYDRYPDLIVRAMDAADVVAGVRYARENGLAIAVRSGGHSLAGFGTANDCVVVDISGMKNISI